MQHLHYLSPGVAFTLSTDKISATLATGTGIGNIFTFPHSLPLLNSETPRNESNSFPWLPLAPSASPSFHPLTGRIQKIWYLSAKNMVSFNKKYGIFHSSPAHPLKGAPRTPLKDALRFAALAPSVPMKTSPPFPTPYPLMVFIPSLCPYVSKSCAIGTLGRFKESFFIGWPFPSPAGHSPNLRQDIPQFPRRTFLKSPAGIFRAKASPQPPQSLRADNLPDNQR